MTCEPSPDSPGTAVALKGLPAAKTIVYVYRYLYEFYPLPVRSKKVPMIHVFRPDSKVEIDSEIKEMADFIFITCMILGIAAVGSIGTTLALIAAGRVNV